MAQYGEVRVDYLTYTTGVSPSEGNATTTISGLVNSPTFSGDVTVEGSLTVDGNLIASGSNIVISSGVFASGTETDPSITFTGDLNTGIYSPSGGEIALSSSGSEVARISSNEKFLIGTTSGAVFTNSTTAKLQVRSGSDSAIGVVRDQDNGNPASLFLTKTRGDDTTIVQSGDTLGEIRFCGSDGVDIRSTAARIYAQVSNTPGFNDMPGKLFFGVTESGTVNAADRMVIDNSGNVGIGGDLEPTERLVVSKGNSGGDVNLLLLENNASTGDYGSKLISNRALILGADYEDAYGGDASYIAFETNDDEKVRITNAGNLGVGVTDPGVKFQVDGDARIGEVSGNAFIDVGFGATEDRAAFIDFVGDTTYNGYGLRLIRTDEGANGSSRLVHRGTGDLRIQAIESGTITFETDSKEAFRVNSNQTVSIGSTNDDVQLEVADNSTSGHVDVLRLRNKAPTGGYGARMTSNRSLIFGADYNNGSSADASFIAFETDASEKVRISSDGKVGIGTSSPSTELHVFGDSTPRIKVEASGDNTAARAANFEIAFDSGVGAALRGYRPPNGQLSDGSLIFMVGGNLADDERMRIRADGNVGIGEAIPNALLHLQATGALTDLYIESPSGDGVFKLSQSGNDVEIINESTGGMTIGNNNASPGYVTFCNGPDIDGNDAFLAIDPNGVVVVRKINETVTGIYTANSLISPTFQVNSSTNNASMAVTRLAGSAANLFLQGSTSGDPVVAGRAAGQINFNAHGGITDPANGYVGYRNLARIRAIADDNPVSGIIPGKLQFETIESGTVSPQVRMTLDSSGVVYIPGSVGITTANPEEKLHINNGNILLTRNNSANIITLQTSVNNGNGSIIYFQKGRGGAGGPSDANGNDRLGTINYQAYLGGAYRQSVQIQAKVSNYGTLSSSSSPGELLFSTTSDGATSTTERLRLNSSGAIGISGENYGASGDILVSQGSAAAPVWTTFGAVKTKMTDNTSVNSSTSFTNYDVLNTSAVFNTGGYTVTTSGIEVPADGVYMATSNVYVNNPSDQRIKVEIAFSVDDVVEDEIGSTMYIRNASSIVDSSAHLTSYLSLAAGERVNVVFRQAGTGDTATTTLSGANSALMLYRIG